MTGTVANYSYPPTDYSKPQCSSPHRPLTMHQGMPPHLQTPTANSQVRYKTQDMLVSQPPCHSYNGSTAISNLPWQRKFPPSYSDAVANKLTPEQFQQNQVLQKEAQRLQRELNLPIQISISPRTESNYFLQQKGNKINEPNHIPSVSGNAFNKPNQNLTPISAKDKTKTGVQGKTELTHEKPKRSVANNTPNLFRSDITKTISGSDPFAVSDGLNRLVNSKIASAACERIESPGEWIEDIDIAARVYIAYKRIPPFDEFEKRFIESKRNRKFNLRRSRSVQQLKSNDTKDSSVPATPIIDLTEEVQDSPLIKPKPLSALQYPSVIDLNDNTRNVQDKSQDKNIANTIPLSGPIPELSSDKTANNTLTLYSDIGVCNVSAKTIKEVYVDGSQNPICYTKDLMLNHDSTDDLAKVIADTDNTNTPSIRSDETVSNERNAAATPQQVLITQSPYPKKDCNALNNVIKTSKSKELAGNNASNTKKIKKKFTSGILNAASTANKVGNEQTGVSRSQETFVEALKNSTTSDAAIVPNGSKSDVSKELIDKPITSPGKIKRKIDSEVNHTGKPKKRCRLLKSEKKFDVSKFGHLFDGKLHDKKSAVENESNKSKATKKRGIQNSNFEAQTTEKNHDSSKIPPLKIIITENTNENGVKTPEYSTLTNLSSQKKLSGLESPSAINTQPPYTTIHEASSLLKTSDSTVRSNGNALMPTTNSDNVLKKINSQKYSKPLFEIDMFKDVSKDSVLSSSYKKKFKLKPCSVVLKRLTLATLKQYNVSKESIIQAYGGPTTQYKKKGNMVTNKAIRSLSHGLVGVRKGSHGFSKSNTKLAKHVESDSFSNVEGLSDPCAEVVTSKPTTESPCSNVDSKRSQEQDLKYVNSKSFIKSYPSEISAKAMKNKVNSTSNLEFTKLGSNNRSKPNIKAKRSFDSISDPVNFKINCNKEADVKKISENSNGIEKPGSSIKQSSSQQCALSLNAAENGGQKFDSSVTSISENGLNKRNCITSDSERSESLISNVEKSTLRVEDGLPSSSKPILGVISNVVSLSSPLKIDYSQVQGSHTNELVPPVFQNISSSNGERKDCILPPVKGDSKLSPERRIIDPLYKHNVAYSSGNGGLVARDNIKQFQSINNFTSRSCSKLSYVRGDTDTNAIVDQQLKVNALDKRDRPIIGNSNKLSHRDSKLEHIETKQANSLSVISKESEHSVRGVASPFHISDNQQLTHTNGNSTSNSDKANNNGVSLEKSLSKGVHEKNNSNLGKYNFKSSCQTIGDLSLPRFSKVGPIASPSSSEELKSQDLNKDKKTLTSPLNEESTNKTKTRYYVDSCSFLCNNEKDPRLVSLTYCGFDVRLLDPANSSPTSFVSEDCEIDSKHRRSSTESLSAVKRFLRENIDIKLPATFKYTCGTCKEAFTARKDWCSHLCIGRKT